jgi:hypothetical protein
VSSDQVQATRAQHGQALRRLADAAIEEAMLHDFPDAMPDDRDRAHRRLIERISAAKHSHAVLQATCAGAATSPDALLSARVDTG